MKTPDAKVKQADKNMLDTLMEAQQMLDEKGIPQEDRAWLDPTTGEVKYYKPSRETKAAISRIDKKYAKAMGRLANK